MCLDPPVPEESEIKFRQTSESLSNSCTDISSVPLNLTNQKVLHLII